MYPIEIKLLFLTIKIFKLNLQLRGPVEHRHKPPFHDFFIKKFSYLLFSYILQNITVYCLMFMDFHKICIILLEKYYESLRNENLSIYGMCLFSNEPLN